MIADRRVNLVVKCELFEEMLRAAVSKLTTSVSAVGRSAVFASVTSSRFSHGHKVETPEEFDNRFIEYFNAASDGWIVRKGIPLSIPEGCFELIQFHLYLGMTELHHHDVVADPKIINAALRACRRVNDHALAVRFLEAVKLQCGDKVRLIVMPVSHQLFIHPVTFSFRF